MDSFSFLGALPICQVGIQQIYQHLKEKHIKFQSKAIGTSIHITSKSHGFEIQYQMLPVQQYKLAALFIYINNSKFSPYHQSNPLPYKIPHQATILSIVMLLGEPTSKSKYLLECSWKHLGIDIIFRGLSWSQEDLTIDYICLYQKPKQATNCSVCHKSARKQDNLNCTNCEIIIYCGIQCKQKHLRLHQMHCQTID